MGKPTKKPKLPLFDLRIRSADNDTIVLKGPPGEAASVVFAGVVAMSVTEPIHVKKMDLKLVATLNLHWEEKYHNSTGSTFVRPFNFSKVVHCYEWDHIDLEGFLHTHDPLNASFISPQNTDNDISSSAGFMSGKQTRSNPGSATSLRNLSLNNLKDLNTSNLKSHKSTTSFKSSSILNFGGGGGSGGIPSTGGSGDVVLQPGNYEFPFYTILDGSIPESIAGYGSCTLSYNLQSTIERGRFTSPIITRRLVHVIRTMTADNPELSETVAVDNTWPGKVDYCISCPTKAIAIGSSLRVDLDIVPLQKGLKLGDIRIKLAEYSSFSTFSGNHTQEDILTTKHLSKITNDHHGNDVWSLDRPVDADGMFYRSHTTVLSQDKWEVKTFLNLPASLNHMTQDCDIGNLIKIRHKLKFSVGLVNPDGHVSELRATLPVTLFISPFIPIKTRSLLDYPNQFQNGNYDDVSFISNGDTVLFKADDETSRLAKSRRQSAVEEDDDVPLVNTDTQALLAPPNYNDRVYDRLYEPNLKTSKSKHVAIEFEDDILEEENIPPATKSKSKGATFSFGDDDEEEEDEDQRGNETDSESGDRDPAPLVISGPAFGTGVNMPISRIGSHSNLHSSFHTVPPVQHLSRTTSFVNTPSATPGNATSYFALPTSNTMNSVLNVIDPPKYDDALKGDVSPGDLTPAYDASIQGSELRMNLDVLDSRLRNLHLSRLHSTDHLPVRNVNSTESSPRVSRRSSSSHIGNIFSTKRPVQSTYDSVKTPPLLSRAASSNSIHNSKSQKPHYKPILSPPRTATIGDHAGTNPSFDIPEDGSLPKAYLASANPHSASAETTPNSKQKWNITEDLQDKRKSSGFFSSFIKKH